MCFPRKPSLGRYHGSRLQWQQAYREARIAAAQGIPPDPARSGIVWKAQLIVAYDRPRLDDLALPVQGRLAAQRLINEVLGCA